MKKIKERIEEFKNGTKKEKIKKIINIIFLAVIIALLAMMIIGLCMQKENNSKTAGAVQEWPEEFKYPETYEKGEMIISPKFTIGQSYNSVDPEETFAKTTDGNRVTLDYKIGMYVEIPATNENFIILFNEIQIDVGFDMGEGYARLSFFKERDAHQVTLIVTPDQKLSGVVARTDYLNNDENDANVWYILNTGVNENERLTQMNKVIWAVTKTDVYKNWWTLGGIQNGYEAGYDYGYEWGYKKGTIEGQQQGAINPIGMIITPISEFFTIKIFGSFSIGDFFTVAMFVSVALIFLKIFAGG